MEFLGTPLLKTATIPVRMLDPQVSLMRILIGDNSRAAPVYSDAQLRTAVTVGPTRPAALPIDVLLSGVSALHRYPSDISGGPFTL